MEEDEDVIFEGSALYSHLQDVGFTDFEVASTKNSRLYVEKPTMDSEWYQKEHNENLIKRTWSWFVIHSRLSEFKRNFVQSVAIKIIKSKLLEESDLLSLEHLSQTVDHFTCNNELFLFENCSNGSPISRWKEYFLFFLPLVFGFLAVLVYNFNNYFCIVCAIITNLFILFGYLLKRLNENDYNYFIGLLHIMGEATKVIMKIRKTINEIKILEKALRKDDSGAEASLESCLREGVDSLTKSFSVMYIASHLEIEKRKLPPEWGSIKELYADRFHPFECTSEHENNLTMKLNWFMNQTSAFLTEFLLHIEKDYKKCLIYNFKKIISTQHAISIDMQLQSIVKLLKLTTSNYWFDDKELNPSLKLYSRSQRESLEVYKSEVTSCLDSLYIHSRLAINHILLLKNIFDENSAKISNKDNADTLNNIYKECDGFKAQFLSCMGCLEEVRDRAQRLYIESNQPIIIQPSIIKNENVSIHQPKDNVTIRLIANKDYAPVDEVFEAIVGDKTKDVNFKEESSSCKLSKRMDFLTRKKQRERCKRVLQEIQPILQQRRQMWNEREKIALERKIHVIDQEDVCCPTIDAANEPTAIESANIIEEIPIVTVQSLPCSEKATESVVYVPSSICNDDYDSDEERLLLYKKVKKELDEDEARRGVDEDVEEDDKDSQFRIFKNFENVFSERENTPFYNMKDIALDGCGNKISDCFLKMEILKRDDAIGPAAFCEINSDNGNHEGEPDISDNYNNGNYIVSDKDVRVTDNNRPIFFNLNVDSAYAKMNLIPNFLDRENLNLKEKAIHDLDKVRIENCIDESSSLSSSSSPSSISTGRDMSEPFSIELTSTSMLSSSLTYPSLPSSLYLSPLDSPLLKEDKKSDPLFVPNASQILIGTPSIPISLVGEASQPATNVLQPDKTSSTEKYLKNSGNENPSGDLSFSCGSNSSDDEGRPIDWSTCGFPSSRKLPLEQCSMPAFGIRLPFEGLNPLIASESQLKAKFTMEEEIFGGVGEAEEELSEDMSDLEENYEDKPDTET